MKYCFFLLLSFGLLLSCSKGSDTDINKDNCLQAMLYKYGMVTNTAGDTYRMSMLQYIFEGKEYYFIDNCTADQAFSPFDCNDVYYFTKDGTINGEFDMAKQIKFNQHAEFKGVVGIRK